MVKSLLKSPLTSIFFAAVWYFAAVFFPTSETYAEKLAEFSMPTMGYIYMIAYGLFLSIILALVFGAAKDKNIKMLLLTAVSVLGTQWAVPMLPALRFGETTGSMTFRDLIFKIAMGATATVLLLALAHLLFKAPPPAPSPPNVPQKQPDKYKVKKLDLVIKMIVLPIIYCVFYFLIWYFLLWRSEPARVYYSGDTKLDSFVQAMITMLLTDVRQVPMALIRGMLYAVLMIPMLFQLSAKRVAFMMTSVLLLMGQALQMLIPSAVMPADVRIAHLIQFAVEAVAFGALASFMLYMSMYREESKQPASPLPAKAAPRAAAQAAAPAQQPAK